MDSLVPLCNPLLSAELTEGGNLIQLNRDVGNSAEHEKNTTFFRMRLKSTFFFR
jgi:hypothetical protein